MVFAHGPPRVIKVVNVRMLCSETMAKNHGRLIKPPAVVRFYLAVFLPLELLEMFELLLKERQRLVERPLRGRWIRTAMVNHIGK
jgi:hypothetical protein